MMTPRNGHGTDLVKLQGEFARWRRERSSRAERIPEELWDNAVSLCESYSVNKVAKTLRLNPTQLKDRVMSRLASQPRFVELEVASPPAVERVMVLVELDGSSGERVTMRFPALDASDMAVSLASAFWSRVR